MTLNTRKPGNRQFPSELRTLGDHIRACRVDLGLTQREVSKILGVNVSTVESWEQGRCVPIEPRIPGIIRFLGYNPLPRGERLGERLWFCRLTLGIPATVLGKQLGMDGMSIRRWEDGLYEPRNWHRKAVERFLLDHKGLFPDGEPEIPKVDPISCGKKSAYRKRLTPA